MAKSLKSILVRWFRRRRRFKLRRFRGRRFLRRYKRRKVQRGRYHKKLAKGFQHFKRKFRKVLLSLFYRRKRSLSSLRLLKKRLRNLVVDNSCGELFKVWRIRGGLFKKSFLKKIVKKFRKKKRLIKKFKIKRPKRVKYKSIRLYKKMKKYSRKTLTSVTSLRLRRFLGSLAVWQQRRVFVRTKRRWVYFIRRKKQRNKRLFRGRRMNKWLFLQVVTGMGMLRNKRFRRRLLVLKRRYVRFANWDKDMDFSTRLRLRRFRRRRKKRGRLRLRWGLKRKRKKR